MKTCIVGGGPSGLFLACLLKKSGISQQVVVIEQNPKNATYGFGVALANTAIDKLNEADPVTMQALESKMYFGSTQVIENCTGEFKLESNFPSGAINRLDLLQVLEQRCAELSVDVRYEQRVGDLAQLDDFDLVVGADGANSLVRSKHEAEFGTRRERRGNWFAWYGCQHTEPGAGLRFRRYRGHSLMAHYYAYTPDMWTFVGETDAQSWIDLGMDEMTDGERRILCEEAFSDVLEGRPLVENNSRWTQFVATTNERWSFDNRVLIGDALFRAHYSIGSGTRLAMEDALGLATALEASSGDVETALQNFEAFGKPRKQKLMAACENSYKWYERVHEMLDVPVLEFIHDFMNRTGRMPADRLRLYAPNFAEAYEAQTADAV